MSFPDFYCCRVVETTVSEKSICSSFLVPNNYILFDSFISDTDCLLHVCENSAHAKSVTKRKQKVLCLKEAILIRLFPGFLKRHRVLSALPWRFILAENGLRDLQVRSLGEECCSSIMFGFGHKHKYVMAYS